VGGTEEGFGGLEVRQHLCVEPSTKKEMPYAQSEELAKKDDDHNDKTCNEYLGR
jgi:hypothetical protein